MQKQNYISWFLNDGVSTEAKAAGQQAAEEIQMIIEDHKGDSLQNILTAAVTLGFEYGQIYEQKQILKDHGQEVFNSVIKNPVFHNMETAPIEEYLHQSR